MERSHARHFDTEAVVRALEGEGELACGLTDEAIRLCSERLTAVGVEVTRVLDLGCGPGVASVQLAERFPQATIIAVDGSPRMLAQARTRAEHHRLAARVRTCHLDLDGDLRTLGPCELVYAAMALHHVQDEVAALASMRRLLAPHGLMCVLERAAPVDVRLADDLGRPGLWDRLRAVSLDGFDRARSTLPGATNIDCYPELLAAAGCEVVVSRIVSDTVTPGDGRATRMWLAAQLHGVVQKLDADAADLQAVGAFLAVAGSQPDPRYRGATVTISRRLYIARATR